MSCIARTRCLLYHSDSVDHYVGLAALDRPSHLVDVLDLDVIDCTAHIKKPVWFYLRERLAYGRPDLEPFAQSLDELVPEHSIAAKD
jgi:hypothetical protein